MADNFMDNAKDKWDDMKDNLTGRDDDTELIADEDIDTDDQI